MRRERLNCFTNDYEMDNYFEIQNKLKNKNLQELVKLDLDDIIQNIEFINDNYMIANKKGTVFYVNQSWCDLCKYSKNEIINKNCKILQGNYTNKLTIDTFKKDLELNNNAIMNICNYTKYKELLHLNIESVYIKNSNGLYLCKVKNID